MANITRIKAKDPRKKATEGAGGDAPEKERKVPKEEAKAPKETRKKAKKAEKMGEARKMSAPVRFITWPFRYVRDSWRELRQVRWPSRGAAWKMVLAVLIYTALFIVIIMLLDALFTLIFNQLLA